jgi:UDP:flavonoid glycosyltransferase YjiC (YdhE family)
VIPTTGSVGDLQPYVALGLGLQAFGHEVRLATHADYEATVRARGLDFFPIEANARAFHAQEAGQRMFAAGANPFVFLREFVRLRRPRMVSLMARCLEACRDADAIVGASTALLIGQSVAEKLKIPFLSASLQPTTPTRFLVNSLFPPLPAWFPLTGIYNLVSHFVVGEILWQLLGPAINKARAEVLGLPPFPFLGPLKVMKEIPVLHGYSAAVVPRPADWHSDHHLTGFWFLRRPHDWRPSAELVDFLQAGPPPVYVGFGSMPNRHPEEVTALVVHALKRAGQRGILVTGWGGLGEAPRSDQVLLLDSVPHDWLFPRVRAVVHHGGAGTTAAALRAGVPAIVVPFMADQPFWGGRVQALGVGPRPIPRKELTAPRLAEAIRTAVHDPAMHRRASELGRRLRAENGVADAVGVIHRYLGIGEEPLRPFQNAFHAADDSAREAIRRRTATMIPTGS